jgi:hypothetical protein
MPHAASSISVQNVLSGLARLGMEPADSVHLGVLCLPMQREESRRIAKLYEFTGKAVSGSTIWRADLKMGGDAEKLQVSPLRQTMKPVGSGRDDRFIAVSCYIRLGALF